VLEHISYFAGYHVGRVAYFDRDGEYVFFRVFIKPQAPGYRFAEGYCDRALSCLVNYSCGRYSCHFVNRTEREIKRNVGLLSCLNYRYGGKSVDYRVFRIVINRRDYSKARKPGARNRFDKFAVCERTVEQYFFVELSRERDPVNFSCKLIELVLDSGSVVRFESIVRALNREFSHSLENCVGFLERAFSRLNKRYTVLSVCRGSVEASDLRSHFFGYRESCGVIACSVDSEARRKFFEGFG